MASRTYNWIGTLGGDWATAADWSSDAIPQSSSTNATIATAGSYTVTVAAGEDYAIGALTLASGTTLEISGGLSLGGTLLSSGTIDIAKGGTLALTGTSGANFYNLGVIDDTSGLLVLDGSLGGSGAIEIASDGTLDLLSATGERVVFGGPDAVLTLATPSGFAGTISGFEQSDTIDLVGVTANSISLSGSVMSLLENGATVDTLQLGYNYAGASFSLTTSGNTATIFETGITYAVEGQVWASPTITWSFATSNYASDADIATFTNIITQTADEAVIEQALSDWAAVTGLTFVEVPDSTTSANAADIRIGWGSFSGSEIGETDYSYTGGNFDGDTLIRLEDPSLDPLSAVNGTLIYNNTETSLLQLALHEIGHSLGMAHTDDVDAIMDPVSTSSNRVLDASDVAGIQSLYAADLSAVACFVTGTGIATPFGRVPVEQLQVGDAVITDAGTTRRIVWLGHRTIDCAAHEDPVSVRPVCIRRDAFAPGQPARDLFLSPDHAIFDGAHLIPVKYLIDDDSVVSMPTGCVTYWHIELETHDILLAEGMPVESYLDTGNRSQFANCSDPSRHLTWDHACWPLCEAGEPIARLRRVLSARCSLIAVNGKSIAAVSAEPPRYRYLLPQRTREVCITRPERVRGLLLDGRATKVCDVIPTRGARVVEIIS